MAVCLRSLNVLRDRVRVLLSRNELEGLDVVVEALYGACLDVRAEVSGRALAVLDFLYREQVSLGVVKRLLGSGSRWLRRLGLGLLGYNDGWEREEVLWIAECLLGLIRHDVEVDIRCEAVVALGGLKVHSGQVKGLIGVVVEGLLDVLRVREGVILGEKDLVRARAARVLGDVGEWLQRRVLCRDLSRDRRVVFSGLLAEIVGGLGRGLSDDVAEVRKCCVLAIAPLGLVVEEVDGWLLDRLRGPGRNGSGHARISIARRVGELVVLLERYGGRDVGGLVRGLLVALGEEEDVRVQRVIRRVFLSFDRVSTLELLVRAYGHVGRKGDVRLLVLKVCGGNVLEAKGYINRMAQDMPQDRALVRELLISLSDGLLDAFGRR